MAMYSSMRRRRPMMGQQGGMAGLGAPPPSFQPPQDYGTGTAPVRQPGAGIVEPPGLPGTGDMPPTMGGGSNGGAPLRQPPGYGGPMPTWDGTAPVRNPDTGLNAFGSPQGGHIDGHMGGTHDDFMASLPADQQGHLKGLMGQGHSFDQAYRRMMGRY